MPKKTNLPKVPKIPPLLHDKIYKTGQTRGADDGQIYQNRVARSSTVLIPYSVYKSQQVVRDINYEKGYIVLIKPSEYFAKSTPAELKALNLNIGENLLIFYELRNDWIKWNPDAHSLKVATSRRPPLGGDYVARVANTTADGDERINRGFTTSGSKGAGIRLFEYAPAKIIDSCRVQLEALFWCAADSEEAMILEGMSPADVTARREVKQADARERGLFDLRELVDNRIIDDQHRLVCPLCLQLLSAKGFVNRLKQAAGRERHDLTVTEVNLFHIKELAYGLFNHRPYNLGWGHHHCNVVCKDSGILDTLRWMSIVVERNRGLFEEER